MNKKQVAIYSVLFVIVISVVGYFFMRESFSNNGGEIISGEGGVYFALPSGDPPSSGGVNYGRISRVFWNNKDYAYYQADYTRLTDDGETVFMRGHAFDFCTPQGSDVSYQFFDINPPYDEYGGIRIGCTEYTSDNTEVPIPTPGITYSLIHNKRPDKWTELFRYGSRFSYGQGERSYANEAGDFPKGYMNARWRHEKGHLYPNSQLCPDGYSFKVVSVPMNEPIPNELREVNRVKVIALCLQGVDNNPPPSSQPSTQSQTN